MALGKLLQAVFGVALLLLLERQFALQAVVLILLVLLRQCGVVGALLQLGQQGFLFGHLHGPFF